MSSKLDAMRLDARRYRCVCAGGFNGHNCEAAKRFMRGAKTCHLSAGAKSAAGATSNRKDYAQFQEALHFMLIAHTNKPIILPDTVDFQRLCTDVYTRLDQGGVCQQTFALFDKGASTSTVSATIGCRHKSELFVSLELCATNWARAQMDSSPKGPLSSESSPAPRPRLPSIIFSQCALPLPP